MRIDYSESYIEGIGRKIREVAQKHEEYLFGKNKNIDEDKRYYSSTGNRFGQYALSNAATMSAGGKFSIDGYHQFFVTGTDEYREPAVGLAMQFAIKHGDKKLLKALKRIEKYKKEVYEYNFEAFKEALYMKESKLSASERFAELREQYRFLLEYESRPREVLLEDMQMYEKGKSEEDKKKYNWLKYYYSLITDKKKKKFMVAKKREIDEIYSNSSKSSKGYKKNYVKLMRKAAKKQKKLESVFHEFSRAHKIIFSFKHIIKPVFFDQKTGSFLWEPEFKIDERDLKSVTQELEEVYYPEKKQFNDSKTL